MLDACRAVGRRGDRRRVGSVRLALSAACWTLSAENRQLKDFFEDQTSNSPPDESVRLADLKYQTSGKAGVIDLLAHDTRTDEVLLVMNEPGAWDGSDERLHELQERFNAYASFLLDGELAESHPELAKKHARIELRCDHIPDAGALELLGMIHDQLAFQEIKMEVVVRNVE
jgi:uncharacterized protein DUF6572